MIPVYEPINQQEAYDMCFHGLELSEKYKTPVMMRITTRLAHSRAGVERRENVAQNEFKLPEDLSNLLRKVYNLDAHMKNNPKDLHNRRAMKLLEEKIRRLVRYYKTKGLLPDHWKYNLANIKLILE